MLISLGSRDLTMGFLTFKSLHLPDCILMMHDSSCAGYTSSPLAAITWTVLSPKWQIVDLA